MLKNNKTIFTSEYTVSVFKENGVECDYVPLFFDHFNFKPKKQEYFEDDRITFNLSGKFEHRKHHLKIIQSWIKKYGGSSKYFLQCSLFNPFLSQEDNEALIARALNNQKYPNVHIMHPMAKNELYNDFLNSYIKQYPNAVFYAAPGLAKKRKDIQFNKNLHDKPRKEWS